MKTGFSKTPVSHSPLGGQYVHAIRSKLCGNCAFLQNFHTRKLGENTVFYGVRNLRIKSKKNIRQYLTLTVLYSRLKKLQNCNLRIIRLRSLFCLMQVYTSLHFLHFYLEN